MEAGTAANCAEEHKCRNYAAFAEAHQFQPITVEMKAVYGGFTVVILRTIGCHLIKTTGEPMDANWFHQNLAIVLSEAMISEMSQPVGRGFRGSG